MSTADLAFASKSMRECLSDFTLNGSKVPRPMRVGVTPTAGEAHVIITHAEKTNTHKSPTTFFISFLLVQSRKGITLRPRDRAINAQRGAKRPTWQGGQEC